MLHLSPHDVSLMMVERMLIKTRDGVRCNFDGEGQLGGRGNLRLDKQRFLHTTSEDKLGMAQKYLPRYLAR